MIEQVLVYRCDFCPRMAHVPYPVALFADAVRPWPPDGWTVIGEKLACPNHDVVVVKRPSPASEVWDAQVRISPGEGTA